MVELQKKMQSLLKNCIVKKRIEFPKNTIFFNYFLIDKDKNSMYNIDRK